MVLALATGVLPSPALDGIAYAAPAAPGATTDVPAQRTGTAAGRDHTVDSGRTDATGHNETGPAELEAADGALPLAEDSLGFTVVEPEAAPAKLQPEGTSATADAVGFVAGKSQELTTERTAHTKEFRNPDGTRTTRVYPQAVHFRGENGAWRPIDTSLVGPEDVAEAVPGVPKGDDRLYVEADDTGLTVAEQADDASLAAMAVGDEDQGISFRLADAEGITGTVADDTVTYEGIRVDADLSIKAQHGMIKETIILNSPDAPRTWTFPLELDDLTPELNQDGAVLLKDSADAVRAVIPTAWMEDSSKSAVTGGPVLSADVNYRLRKQDGGWALQVTMDDAWLDDPDRVYPVYVDPSIDDIESSGDTFVQDDWPDGNFSGDDELKIGSYDGGSSRAYSFLKFRDIDNALRHRYILNADLGLFNHWSSSCSAHEVRVHQVTEGWSVGTATWSNRPSVKSKPVATDSFAHGANCGGSEWEVIDLGRNGVELVQGWVDGSTDNHGISLRTGFTDAGAWKRFGSRNSANEPYLAITHSAWGAAYSVGAYTDPLTGHQGGEVEVNVKNLGAFTWEATGWDEFRLGARVRDYDSGKLLDAVAFTRLDERVTPGDDTTLDARIPQMPPGKYKVTFDMQRLRDQRWMSNEDVAPVTVNITSQDVGPRLTDVYPQPGGQVGDLTPALFVDAETVDHWPSSADIDYWFEVCEGTTGDPVNCVDSGWVDRRIWDVPADTLSWGEQSVWRVQAREAGVEGPRSPYYSFITAVEQPAITSHLGGGGTPGANGREVDPRIGNYTTVDTDAQVATVGPALTVTRTYNSRDPRDDNAFGAGWSTRYDMRVEPDQDGSGNVVVTYPSGRQVRFGHNPDGGYAPPYGSFATLTRTADDGWRLTDKAQTDYVFDAQGRITEVTDYRGRSQTMTYAGDRLTTITGLGGRSLHFTWADGHVITVTTDGPDAATEPLTWTYTYAGDRLTQVCGSEDTAGACTTYTYGDGSHHRTVLRDAGPYSYWRLGEQLGADQAQSDLLLNREAHEGTYHDVTLGLPGALESSTDTAASFNGTSSYVRLPDQLVSDTPYLTVELWFQTTEQGVLFSYQDHTLDENTTGKYTPALYVGTDGKLRGEFWNGSAAPITSDAPVNDGAWHHAALTAAGSTQTLYLDGQAVGTLSGDISQYDQRFVYLGAGYWNNWPATSGTTGYFNGGIDEVAVYVRPLGARTIAEHHASGATAQQLTRVTLPSGRVHAKISYDTALDRVASYTDANGGIYKLSPHRLTGTDGAPSTDGQAAVAEDSTVTVTITDPDDRASSYTYDPLRGHRVIAQTDAAGNTATFAYDTGGFLAATTAPDGTVTRIGHDERGNKISQTTCRDAGAEETCHTSYTEYFLNSDDPLDPRNDQVIAHRDARSSSATDDTYRTSYGYNAHGDKVFTTTPATADFSEGRTVTHTYTDGTEPAAGGGTVPAGLLATSTLPRGGATTREYTAAGSLARVTDPSGVVTEYTYDALGRELSRTVISDAHPGGVTTTTRYDGESRVVKTTGPVTVNAVTGEKHQAVTRYTYDADGHSLRVTVSDSVGEDVTRTTTRTYDGHGRLATLDAPGLGVESYSYDVYGNQVSRTMPGGETFTYEYTPLGQLAEVTLQAFDEGESEPVDVVLDSYAYDAVGRLAEHTDAMGRTTRSTYYDDGLPAEKILVGFHDPDGTTRDLVLSERHYDAAGNLVSETTGNGSVTVDYEVDAAGHTTAEVLDPGSLARRIEYTYDAGGSVLTATRTGAAGARTERVTYQRNVVGDIVRTTVENGDQDLVTTYEVDDRGLVTAVTSPRGNAGTDPAAHTATFDYDVRGRLVETVAAPVTVEEYGSEPVTDRPTSRTGYNAFGEVTAKQGPNGGVARTAYDAAGRPVSTTLPSYTPPAGTQQQATVTRSYDEAGRLATETDALGNVTSYSYDQLGRLVSVTRPAPTDSAEQPVTRFTYDLLGERLSVTGPTGARTEFTYDDLGRRITTTAIERHPAAAAYTTTSTYDDAGNVVATTAPDGTASTGTWNAAGEPLTVTDASGGVIRYGYGPTGLRTSVTGPLGQATRTTYDQAGRVTEVTELDAQGTVLSTRSQSYDAAGNPVAVTGPLGHTVEQSYDAAGRLTKLVEPVDADTSLTTRFGYDAAGHRTRLTDGRGNTTWYTYTSRGLPESVIEPATTSHPDPADRTWTTVYNAENQPVERRLPGGVTQTLTYDALGRVVEKSGAGAEAATTTGTFGYDLAGRVTSVSAPGGTNTYTWDDRGNLLSADGPSGTATFAYDAMGRMVQRTDAAGATTFGYDAAGRLATAVDPLTGATLSYGYDGASRLTSVGYGSSGAQRTLDRDAFGRIVSDTLTAPGGTATTSVSYGYDDAGQLISKSTTGRAGAGENTYTYDRAGRMTGWTAPDGTVTAYEWDAAGNRVRAGDVTATYDARNRVTSAGAKTYSWSARGTLRSVTAAVDAVRNVKFDAFGRMVSDDGTAYAYDAVNRLVQRGSTQLSYADLTNNPVAAGDHVFARTPGGTPLSSATADGSNAVALSQNTHRDVTGSFDPATGQLTSSSAYSPFGKVTDRQGTGTSLGYQGGWTDPESGKVNMHARWYDPALGTFASRDSWTLNPVPSIQANRYTYGNGTPLNGTDPTGHCFGVCVIAFGALALVAAGTATAAGTGASQSQGASWTDGDAWAQAWERQKRGWRMSWRWLSGFFSDGRNSSASGGGGSFSWPSPYGLAGTVARQAQAQEQAAWAAQREAAQAQARREAARRAGLLGTVTATYSGGGGYGGCGVACRTKVGFRSPPPPPPPTWSEILKAVLSQDHARPATEPSVDPEHKQYVEDTYKRAVDDLELTPKQLRQYFKMFPRGGERPGTESQPSLGTNADTSGDDTNQDPCSKPKSQRFYYQPLVDDAPTGATALICPSDLKGPNSRSPRKGKWNPPGYVSKRNPEGGWAFHRSHIIGDRFSGDWVQENIFSGYQRMNGTGMARCEYRMAEVLKSGQPVLYSGQLGYGNGRNDLPTGINMTAFSSNGLMFSKKVKNISGKQVTC